MVEAGTNGSRTVADKGAATAHRTAVKRGFSSSVFAQRLGTYSRSESEPGAGFRMKKDEMLKQDPVLPDRATRLNVQKIAKYSR